MIDKDLENQILVRLDDWTYRQIIKAADASDSFKAQVVRRCILRCIRQDDAPRWKKIIRKILGL